jgi:hypothetical protein
VVAVKFLLQNHAILGNVALTNLPLVSSKNTLRKILKNCAKNPL